MAAPSEGDFAQNYLVGRSTYEENLFNAKRQQQQFVSRGGWSGLQY